MSQEEKIEVETSLNKQLEEKIRKIRDSNQIDFTDKKDYAPKLKLMAEDSNCSYQAVYKAFKSIGREQGTFANTETKKKSEKKGNTNFNFSAKPTSEQQSKLAKQKQELESKKNQMESEIKMQEMMLGSPVFDMMKQQNEVNLLMVRELVKGFGGKVADEDKYKMLASQLALKEIQSGWQPSGAFQNLFLGLAIIGVMVAPLIPQIRNYMSSDDDEIEQSETPLDEIPKEKQEERVKENSN